MKLTIKFIFFFFVISLLIIISKLPNMFTIIYQALFISQEQDSVLALDSFAQ